MRLEFVFFTTIKHRKQFACIARIFHMVIFSRCINKIDRSFVFISNRAQSSREKFLGPAYSCKSWSLRRRITRTDAPKVGRFCGRILRRAAAIGLSTAILILRSSSRTINFYVNEGRYGRSVYSMRPHSLNRSVSLLILANGHRLLSDRPIAT